MEQIKTELESFIITFATIFLIAFGDSLSTMSWKQLSIQILGSLAVAAVRVALKAVYNSFKKGTPTLA